VGKLFLVMELVAFYLVCPELAGGERCVFLKIFLCFDLLKITSEDSCGRGKTTSTHLSTIIASPSAFIYIRN